MHVRRVHLWWIVPFAAIAVTGIASCMVSDSLRFGSATPLHRAVLNDDAEAVTRLLADHADVNTRMKARLYPETWGATPLHLAAGRNNTEIVAALIRAGDDKDAVDDLGYTPLHAALKSGANDAAEALIRSGARVRSTPQDGSRTYAIDNDGQPLATALAHTKLATVQALLDAGADPTQDVGPNAMALADGPDLLPKMQFLFDRGFSVEGTSHAGRPLHTAAFHDHVEAIIWLLDHGANTEAADENGHFTPLLTAAYVGAENALKTLIQRGANPQHGTSQFGSPVYAAAFSGKRDTVRLLLSMNLGIDLQAGRESDKATPLHFAYWNNDPVMADLLINAGARKDARTTDGRLPGEFTK